MFGESGLYQGEKICNFPSIQACHSILIFNSKLAVGKQKSTAISRRVKKECVSFAFSTLLIRSYLINEYTKKKTVKHNNLHHGKTFPQYEMIIKILLTPTPKKKIPLFYASNFYNKKKPLKEKIMKNVRHIIEAHSIEY